MNIQPVSRERLAVIENIERALEDGEPNRKVEISDPIYTSEDVKRKILHFDNLKKNPINRLKAEISRRIAEKKTKEINQSTKIIGLENALSVKGAAIITANHFSPFDNTVIRHLAMQCERNTPFHILVQEGNMFMKGSLGFLMKNCYTMPTSKNHLYTAKNLTPSIEKILKKDGLLLVYPECEMWFNYKKPRPHAIGAYYYAARFGVPIIPTFIGMEETDGYDSDGFRRLKYTLFVEKPIYPDDSIKERERAKKMKDEDERIKISLYESFYKREISEPFSLKNDIAGYPLP